MNARDTIVALSTPPGRGGLGVIRLSGQNSRGITEQILRFAREPRWRPWSSELADLVDTERTPYRSYGRFFL